MKKICFFLLFSFLFIPIIKAEDLAPNAKSSIIVEQSTGEIIYENNSHEKMAPASMTKIMSLLLIMESLENKTIKWDDEVTVSENASSMGGSQILLETNEKMKVEDLVKGISIASGNELAVSIKQSLVLKEEIII